MRYILTLNGWMEDSEWSINSQNFITSIWYEALSVCRMKLNFKPSNSVLKPSKNVLQKWSPVLRNYSLFTNFISMEASVHKTLILYEIAVGSNKGSNLETIFQVYIHIFIYPVVHQSTISHTRSQTGHISLGNCEYSISWSRKGNNRKTQSVWKFLLRWHWWKNVEFPELHRILCRQFPHKHNSDICASFCMIWK